MPKPFHILCFIISICIIIYGCVGNKELLVNLGLALLGVVLASIFRCLCNFLEELFQLIKSQNNYNISELFKNSFSGIQWKPVFAVVIIVAIVCALAKESSFNLEDVILILSGIGVCPLIAYLLKLNAQSDVELSRRGLYPAYTLAWNCCNYLDKALPIFISTFSDGYSDEHSDQDANVSLSSKKLILLFSSNMTAVELHDSHICKIADKPVDGFNFPIYDLQHTDGHKYRLVILYAEDALQTLTRMCTHSKPLRWDQLNHQVELLHKTVSEILSKDEYSFCKNNCIRIRMSAAQSLENGGLVSLIISRLGLSSHEVNIDQDENGAPPQTETHNEADQSQLRNGSFSRTEESRVVNHTVESISAHDSDEKSALRTDEDAGPERNSSFSRTGESRVVNRTVESVPAHDSDEKSALPQTGSREEDVKPQTQLRRRWPGNKDPNKRRGITALMSAVKIGNRKDVEDLLQGGADVNAKDEDGKTALIWAALHGNVEVVAQLLGKGAGVDAMDKFGRTALILAAEKGEVEVAAHLLAKGADVNAKDEGRKTALIWAVIKGNVEVVAHLLGKGAHVDAMDRNGTTALMSAANKGNVEVMVQLSQKGADVNAKDKRGKTALILAADKGNVEVVAHLLGKGADVHTKDEYGRTALIWAAYTEKVEVVAHLLAKGADVNAKDEDGKTALIWAAIDGKVEVVAHLLGKGANVDGMDKSQRTALHWAAERGNVGAVKYLLKYQAQVNARDEEGKTALELATDAGHTDVVQLLRTRDKYGKTALELATDAGRSDVVKLLRTRDKNEPKACNLQ